MANIKMKKLLAENMRRFGTKNLKNSLNESADLRYAKKASYVNMMDIADAASDLAGALEQPTMDQLPVVQHAIKQLNAWAAAKKPAPYAIYALVREAPALLDKMQAKSKKAWLEMRSHWGGIVDDIADEDEIDYVTDFEPADDDMI